VETTAGRESDGALAGRHFEHANGAGVCGRLGEFDGTSEGLDAPGLPVSYLPGLGVAILDIRENVRHWHASTTRPQIFYSMNLRAETFPREPGPPPPPDDFWTVASR